MLNLVLKLDVLNICRFVLLRPLQVTTTIINVKRDLNINRELELDSELLFLQNSCINEHDEVESMIVRSKLRNN